MQAILGVLSFILFAWIFSEHKRNVEWKFILKGVGLQLAFILILLKVTFITQIFSWINRGVIVLQNVTDRATQFLFGYLAGGPSPFIESNPDSNFIVVFRVLPLILVVSALSALLFHWKIIPLIVKGFGLILGKALGIRGSLGLGSAATVFFGTIEAPLLIKPYLAKMNRSDLFALITCSMATVSGTVMVLYSRILTLVLPNALTHFIVASLMSVPAALVIAKIMIPNHHAPGVISDGDAELVSTYENSLDALTRGISEGLAMIFGIIGTILVFFALIYLANEGLSLINSNLSVESMMAFCLRPVMWLTGIEWSESLIAAKLMGTKIVLNEFVAYMELAKTANELNPKSLMILTYALCGFANFGSAGIIAGSLSALFPERKKEISQLTLRSLVSGNLATLMTAALVGLLSIL